MGCSQLSKRIKEGLPTSGLLGGGVLTDAYGALEEALLIFACLGAQPLGFCESLAGEFGLALPLIKRVKLKMEFALSIRRQSQEKLCNCFTVSP